MKKIAPFLLVIPFFAFISPKAKPLPALDAAYFDKTMVYIPIGSFNTYIADDREEKLWEEKGRKTVTVSAFYMYPTEVTNYMYRTFTNEIKAKDTALYRSVLPDTTVWRDKLAYNEPYVEYYFRHPAYNDYPVVGVTYEQAERFCKWLSEKYATDPKAKLKNMNFRLPTREQWNYSAVLSVNSKKGTASASDFKLFPWGGPYLRNSKGAALANYTRIDEASVIRAEAVVKYNGKEIAGKYLIGASDGRAGIAGSLNDNADITAPVYSYWPNDAGLYNMAGNVEEFIREKGFTKGGSWNDTGYYLRNDVEEKYDEKKSASATRGFRFVMEAQKSI